VKLGFVLLMLQLGKDSHARCSFFLGCEVNVINYLGL
jgi:hypothetical protein